MFVVGTPKAGSQALLRQWPGTERIHDVLALGPDCPAVAIAMVRALFGGRTWDDAALKGLLGERGSDEIWMRSLGEALAEPAAATPARLSVAERLRIATAELEVKRFRDGRNPGLVDRLEPFRTLLPAGDLVVNGQRKAVSWSDANESFEIAGDQALPTFAHAKAIASWCALGRDASSSTRCFGFSISKRLVRVELRLDRIDLYEGATFDEPPRSCATAERTASFVTDALILRPEQDAGRTKAALEGLECLLWNYLAPLIRGNPRSVLAIADEARAELAVLEIADGPTALPDLLARDDFSLLGAALHTGFFALMDCPCCHTTSLGKPDPAPVSADPGCPWCLQSPTKLAGLQGAAVEKRAFLTWLGSIPIIDGYPYEERIRHKYELLDDNRRLTGHVSGGSLCEQILAVLESKLALALADQQRAQVAISTATERLQHPRAAGWYGPGNTIRVNPTYEFAVIDILAHEYAHNWQAMKPLPPASPASLTHRHYDDENVEAPGNLPFFGALFVEGSAVWIESHAMDYFAYRSQLDSSGVGAEQPGDFQYWQGLRVVKYLEQRFGMQRVFDFLATGDIAAATDGAVHDYRALYQAAGLEGFLVNEGTKAADGGLVPLFAKLNLASHESLIRISAWLARRNEGISWSDLPQPVKDRKGNYPDFDEFVRSAAVREALGRLTIATILDTLITRDAGADDVLAEHGQEDHVIHPQSREIPLFLACHLKSCAQRPTSNMLEPMVDWLASRFREELSKLP